MYYLIHYRGDVVNKTRDWNGFSIKVLIFLYTGIFLLKYQAVVDLDQFSCIAGWKDEAIGNISKHRPPHIKYLGIDLRSLKCLKEWEQNLNYKLYYRGM